MLMPETSVTGFDGSVISFKDGTSLKARTVIWASGVTAIRFAGLESATLGRGARITVDKFNKVVGYDDIFAIGDICTMATDKYPNGHPQLAQAQARIESDVD